MRSITNYEPELTFPAKIETVSVSDFEEALILLLTLLARRDFGPARAAVQKCISLSMKLHSNRPVVNENIESEGLHLFTQLLRGLIHLDEVLLKYETAVAAL